MSDRVWDRFLTEQDKAHLQLSRERRVGFGTQPALLLIDLYRWVFGDEPLPLLEGMKLWPGYCGPAAWNAIPQIQRLQSAARAAGIPVIHVTGLNDETSGVPGWNEAAHRDAGRRARSEDPVARERYARRYEIMPELGPLPGEVLLHKTSPSAFWGTPLVGHLNYLDVDTILVAGESTSGCVRASVVEGCTNRYRMQVVEECVFDRHEACHAINLFDMDQKYASVISLDEATGYLSTIRGGAAGTSQPQRELIASR